MSALVDVRGLTYRYPDGVEALRGIDFRLDAGENVAMLGPNGSGKTTLLLHLNGLLGGGEGSIEICGRRLDLDRPQEARRKVGVVFQDSETQLFMPTVLEDVAFGPLNSGCGAEEAERRAREALERTGIGYAAERAPYHLSSGEKKRVAIAGVLAVDSEILVLDEPTTYLDPPAQMNLLELLRGLPQGKIVATHDIGFAAALCNRAVFLDQGRIADAGPVADVVRRQQWGLAGAM